VFRRKEWANPEWLKKHSDPRLKGKWPDKYLLDLVWRDMSRVKCRNMVGTEYFVSNWIEGMRIKIQRRNVVKFIGGILMAVETGVVAEDNKREAILKRESAGVQLAWMNVENGSECESWKPQYSGMTENQRIVKLMTLL